jgi:hypothetical protein
MNITKLIRRRAPRSSAPFRPVDAGLIPRPLG